MFRLWWCCPVEPKTLKFVNQFLPWFAAGFVAVLLLWLLILALWPNHDDNHFQGFLTFAGTAIGSVTGYYFGGTKHQPQSWGSEQRRG
jgi:hypothetical protein